MQPSHTADLPIAGRELSVVFQAILAMARVRIERDVGDDAELRKALLHSAHGARNWD